MSRLTRDGTVEPISREQTLRRERGQGRIHFPRSTDHEKNWQPTLAMCVDAMCDDHTYSYVTATSFGQLIEKSNRTQTKNLSIHRPGEKGRNETFGWVGKVYSCVEQKLHLRWESNSREIELGFQLTSNSLRMEKNRLTRDGTAEPVSRDQIFRRERGQGTFHFPCSADHEQDWQPYPVDPCYCYMCDHT